MLELDQVTKSFDGVRAVNGVSLTVQDGEFFSLLGPSGCGKTSLLRTIAGIYVADAGSMSLNGNSITNRPMSDRNIALVFQNYALFPHMSVFDNVAFGLQMRRVPRAEIGSRVTEALSLVRMEDFKKRKPSELSGGQQQRVALARAIVVRPGLLLLDEPLSNLDAKLRDEMRDEIRKVQQSVGITTVLVTHDIREAFAVSDRVGIMKQGTLEQVGTPAEVYDRPATKFVAGFIGHQNIFEGRVEGVHEGVATIRCDDGLALRAVVRDAPCEIGSKIWGTIRPERIRMGGGWSGSTTLTAQVEDATFLGSVVELRLRAGDTRLRALACNVGQPIPAVGTSVPIGWNDDDLFARADTVR